MNILKTNGRNEENHFSETQTQNKFAVYKKKTQNTFTSF